MFPLTTRILIVDDQSPMRELVRSQLRSLGFGAQTDLIRQAVDGKDAFRVLEEGVQIFQPIQLIVSDWEMPNMSGFELLKAVRSDERFAKLPVILLTAVNKQDQVMDAIKAGVTNYMTKPFSKAVLIEKLQRSWITSQSKK